MLFPTVEYGLFFLAAFAGAWALRRRSLAHRSFLLAASYLFYGAWDWRFLPALIGLSLLAAWAAQALELPLGERVRRWILASGVAATLALLALFKYLGFGASVLFGALEAVGLGPVEVRLPEVALPVGVSFFTFHAISLMVDAYRRRIPVRVRALDALLYVAFFPQLVAGPILRAASFLPALAQPPSPAGLQTATALRLIVSGLVKKVLIAQSLATALVDPVFEAPGAHSGLEVLLGVYAYAAQIYCDFSGYTDMALGSALLLGYALPVNFDAPYRADSPRDFWRRWHISLSSWLRDYLFIPLGGSRAGRARTFLALAVTMLLGGLWHGAAWTFVVWGAWHGGGLIVHRLWSETEAGPVQAVRASRAWRWLAPLLTFHFVCLGWVLFRSPSLAEAAQLWRALFAADGATTVSGAVLLAICLGLFAQRLPRAALDAATARFSRLPLAVQGALLALALVAVDVLGPRGIAPFIYFRF